ncbi:MAG: hypothetical protein ACM3JB_16405 [Acidobacteriaceae bacterium]
MSGDNGGVDRILRFFALGLLAFVSLAATAESTTRIYVFADWDSPQHAWIPIYCDGALVAKVKAGKFLAIEVPPGQHTLLAGDGVPLPFEIFPGKDVFVAVQYHMRLYPSSKSTIPVLAIFPESEARIKIVHLVYIETKQMHSPLVSRQDPTVLWRPELKKRNAN